MFIVVDLIILAVLILCVGLGYKRGLAGCLIRVLAFFIAVVVSAVLFKPAAALVTSSTQIDENIQSSIVSVFEKEDLNESDSSKSDSGENKDLSEQNDVNKQKQDSPIMKYISDKVEDATEEKKMEIVKDQSLEPTEKVFRLCMLAKTSGKTFEVLTNKGAFRFERCGDNVFVSHALPEYKNKKDQPTYNFQKIGGILFRENSTLIDYEDLYETFQLLASGEEFDTERKSLEQNAIINEIGQVTEKEVTEGENQMQFSDEEQKKMNNAIIAGQTDVVEKMLNEKNKELAENKTQPSVMEQETMFQSTDERVIPDDFFQQDFEQRLAELGQEQKSMDDILYSPTHNSDDFEH